MTRFALIALSALVATAAQAEELSSGVARSVLLEAASGVVYYTPEANGLHVVATIANAEGGSPLRFSTVLADGQVMMIEAPSRSGGRPVGVTFRRMGEQIVVDESQTSLVRASLD